MMVWLSPVSCLNETFLITSMSYKHCYVNNIYFRIHFLYKFVFYLLLHVGLRLTTFNKRTYNAWLPDTDRLKEPPPRMGFEQSWSHRPNCPRHRHLGLHLSTPCSLSHMSLKWRVWQLHLFMRMKTKQRLTRSGFIRRNASDFSNSVAPCQPGMQWVHRVSRKDQDATVQNNYKIRKYQRVSSVA